jgi:AcrR family transcriptional regulator
MTSVHWQGHSIAVDDAKVCDVPRQRRIDRESIFRESLALADERGLHAVTLQAVASRLGVTAMSLYGHIDSKEALLDGIVERLLAEFDLPDESLPWLERLGLIGRSARDSARRHPDVFALLLNRSAATPGAHRVRNAVKSALMQAGLPTPEVERAERLLTTVIVGFAVSEATGRFHQSEVDADADYAHLELLIENAIKFTIRSIQP